MADKKISELTAAGTITGTEQVPVVQGGTTKRTTIAGLAPGLIGAYGRWKTGVDYRLFPQVHSTTTTAIPGNQSLRLAPIIVPNTVVVSHLGFEITLASEAGGIVRLGVYADDGTGYPGALLAEPTAQGVGTSVTVQELALASNLTLPPGIYWGGGCVQLAPTTRPTWRSIGFGASGLAATISTGVPAANVTFCGYQQGSVSGALPANFTATPSMSQFGEVPRIHFRLAS